MPKRESGNVKVTIQFVNEIDEYKAVVSAGGDRRTIYVRPLRGVSVDSKEGYDDAARAAISFAIDEGLNAQPDYDGGTYVLRRSPRKRTRSREVMAAARSESARRYRAARPRRR